MYDQVLLTINLTSDEIDILTELLTNRLETCLSIGEEITVRDLLDKLK